MITARQITVLWRPGGDLSVVFTWKTSWVASLVISRGSAVTSLGTPNSSTLAAPAKSFFFSTLITSSVVLPLFDGGRLERKRQERLGHVELGQLRRDQHRPVADRRFAQDGDLPLADFGVAVGGQRDHGFVLPFGNDDRARRADAGRVVEHADRDRGFEAALAAWRRLSDSSIRRAPAAPSARRCRF